MSLIKLELANRLGCLASESQKSPGLAPPVQDYEYVPPYLSLAYKHSKTHGLLGSNAVLHARKAGSLPIKLSPETSS